MTELVLDQAKGTARFVRHFVEMLVVMMLGMCVLGGAFAALHDVLFGSGYADAWRDHVALALPCRRSWVRVPSSALAKALEMGLFLWRMLAVVPAVRIQAQSAATRVPE